MGAGINGNLHRMREIDAGDSFHAVICMPWLLDSHGIPTPPALTAGDGMDKCFRSRVFPEFFLLPSQKPSLPTTS